MNLNQYELLIRSMMLEFPEIREAVKAVDRMRLDTVGKIFAELSLESDELEMRTLTSDTTLSQDGNVLSELSAESYERQLKLRYEFFIRP
jgi:hypothetical protein